uniref:Secretory carrier-associated membrane protein 2 n=1 Tax=Lygus hesperus TaxID=30085 RepID=A0A0A9YMK3_LYGHE
MYNGEPQHCVSFDEVDESCVAVPKSAIRTTSCSYPATLTFFIFDPCFFYCYYFDVYKKHEEASNGSGTRKRLCGLRSRCTIFSVRCNSCTAKSNCIDTLAINR